MKEKVRIKRDNKQDLTFIDYYKIKDFQSYRYGLLRTFFQSQQILVMMDTNLGCIEKVDHKEAVQAFEKKLQSRHIPCAVFPIQNRRQPSILGILMNKKQKEMAYKLIFTCSGDDITESFFKEFLSTYDIEVGIGFVKDVDEIFEAFRRGYLENCFNSDYFEQAVFDSIFLKRMKTTMPVSMLD